MCIVSCDTTAVGTDVPFQLHPVQAQTIAWHPAWGVTTHTLSTVPGAGAKHPHWVLGQRRAAVPPVPTVSRSLGRTASPPKARATPAHQAPAVVSRFCWHYMAQFA